MSASRTTRSARRLGLGVLSALASGMLIMPAAHADVGTDIAQAFKDGKANVSFRYRYENVDQDNFSKDANASTLRSRISFQTAAWQDLSLVLELDDVRTLGDESYNSTRNNKTDRPTVLDPVATDLNVAALKYMGIANTEIIVGRQKIVRGNERFVGPVGWRQNEQTYDAGSINYKYNDKLQAYYAYVRQVNRVVGPDDGTPPADFNGNTHLADVSYTFSPAAKLTAYGYFLEFDEALALSSQTLGLRLAGDIKLNEQFGIPYAAEWATQDDYADNPNNYSADYYLAEAGLRWQKVTVKLSWEVLEGDTVANHQFQTPLATAHAFQGWADQFASTPTGGIENAFVTVDFPVLGANLKLRYDDYQSETGSVDYGNELGVWLTYPVGTNYSVAVKYAAFDADSDPANTYVDVDKVWLMFSANF
ncbi:MAG: alginate export family protein [Gammaproteobacteria bacterium]|nr:alginate export family protein [Gammaproteobacteria bacterium]